jgi:broad specificity phosphatase PhoE/predicted kinase
MDDSPALVIVMVGMPARGKSFMARKMSRYLRWRGHATRVFNVGSYRRELLGAGQGHEFFDPTNEEALLARFRMARAAMDDMLKWLAAGGRVAVYDATNSTRRRRAWVREVLGKAGHQVVFVESVCTDPAIVEANVRLTKISSPDYVDRDPGEAVVDFRARIAHYESAYTQLDESDGSWIRINDVGRRFEMHQITGYLLGRLVFFLMNLHITPRPIWLTRHGQSEDNVRQLLGGDSQLSPVGFRYARQLGAFFDPMPPNAEVWTSTLQRTIQTSAWLMAPMRRLKSLDEIDAGICDGLTYEEVERRWPAEFAARRADKLGYRYPQGESYRDVITRLDPVIIEIERSRHPILVIAHQAVLRALYAYLADVPVARCPHLPMPLHTLIELTPTAYGAEEVRHPLLPEEP